MLGRCAFLGTTALAYIITFNCFDCYGALVVGNALLQPVRNFSCGIQNASFSALVAGTVNLLDDLSFPTNCFCVEARKALDAMTLILHQLLQGPAHNCACGHACAELSNGHFLRTGQASKERNIKHCNACNLKCIWQAKLPPQHASWPANCFHLQKAPFPSPTSRTPAAPHRKLQQIALAGCCSHHLQPAGLFFSCPLQLQLAKLLMLEQCVLSLHSGKCQCCCQALTRTSPAASTVPLCCISGCLFFGQHWLPYFGPFPSHPWPCLRFAFCAGAGHHSSHLG